MTDRFSKRFGHSIKDKPIEIREDAPQELREFIIQLIYEFGYQPSFLRGVICRVLRKSPDRSNWSEYPNIDYEVNQLMEESDWFYIYDIIEAFANKIEGKYKAPFHEELNGYFKANGIGWKLHDGQIETRGDLVFEGAVEKVENTLEQVGLKTAQTEIKEAISDLSRRPEPDITGAIQHSLACLECVCREATGDKKATLGDLMKKYPDIVPKPLDKSITFIWGFSSEQGRHLREGRDPEYIEAELLVELSSTVSNYLAKKIGNIEIQGGTTEQDDFPF
jgi:hypothetical protein